MEEIPFRVAQFGCPHSDRDIEQGKRYPVTRGAQATVASGKICDVYHVLGDWTGLQSVTDSAKAAAITRISADINGARDTLLSQGKSLDLKSITGNHISEQGSDPFDLYQRAVQNTIDALGPLTHPEQQDPNADYPWESYYYIKGNNLFFFLGDRNDMEAPYGKKNSTDIGGHPAGSILKSSLAFFVDTAIKHSDKNIFLHTHQGLPNTVVGTHTNINAWRGHNNYPVAVKQWKGTIGSVYIKPNGEGEGTFELAESIFETILTQWRRLAVGCANSHTHAPVNYKSNPTFTGITSLSDRSNHEVETNLPVDDTTDLLNANNDHFAKIGDSFVMNIGNLTKYHSDPRILAENNDNNIGVHPHGTIWEFEPGSDVLKSFKLIIENAKVYGARPNDPPIDLLEGQLYDGYYREYQLKHPFTPEFNAVDPIQPSTITNLNVVRNGEMVGFSFNGNADGFAIVAGSAPVVFRPSDNVTHLPSYDVQSGETLIYQGNRRHVNIVTPYNHFIIYAMNGSNGSVLYSDVVVHEIG